VPLVVHFPPPRLIVLARDPIALRRVIVVGVACRTRFCCRITAPHVVEERDWKSSPGECVQRHDRRGSLAEPVFFVNWLLHLPCRSRYHRPGIHLTPSSPDRGYSPEQAAGLFSFFGLALAWGRFAGDSSSTIWTHAGSGQPSCFWSIARGPLYGHWRHWIPCFFFVSIGLTVRGPPDSTDLLPYSNAKVIRGLRLRQHNLTGFWRSVRFRASRWGHSAGAHGF